MPIAVTPSGNRVRNSSLVPRPGLPGQLNRSLLRSIVFNDPQQKAWLESLLHPIIRDEIIHQLASASSPYSILVSPLLLETNQHELCDRTLVVDAPVELQKSRASVRDGNTEADIQKIIDSQMSREEKLANASDVIINDQTERYLEDQVDNMHRKYLSLIDIRSSNN